VLRTEIGQFSSHPQALTFAYTIAYLLCYHDCAG
jgi:hypothetical protein